MQTPPTMAQLHALLGLPGRLTVQKTLLRQFAMPHEVVRWPRMHDMHAILQNWPLLASMTSMLTRF